jgi:hypothetical protein
MRYDSRCLAAAPGGCPSAHMENLKTMGLSDDIYPARAFTRRAAKESKHRWEK